MVRLDLSINAIIKLQPSWVVVRFRSFAVKELPWCSTSKSKPKPINAVSSQEVPYRPIERFGIVAAISKNNIIGVKGNLPWNIPADREEFVRLTRDKILVIGRNTFEERPTLSHISHAAQCIVISKSLAVESIQTSISSIKTEVLIVRSFLEALDLARRITETKNHDFTNDLPNDIDCWIAGGEAIYSLSVLHPAAWVLHLTVIDIDVDVSLYLPSEVARFPPKYHWDTRFTQCSATESTTQDDKSITFVQYIYSKKSFS